MPDFLLSVGAGVDSGHGIIEAAKESQINLLHEQNVEMTKLLRRCWVKYCMLHEQDQESLQSLDFDNHDGNVDEAELEHFNSNSSFNYEEKKEKQLDIRGLVNSGDRLLDRLILKGLMNEKIEDVGPNSDEDNDTNDDSRRREVEEVRRRVKAKVQLRVINDVGDVVDDDDDRLQRVGRWLGVTLRR